MRMRLHRLAPEEAPPTPTRSPWRESDTAACLIIWRAWTKVNTDKSTTYASKLNCGLEMAEAVTLLLTKVIGVPEELVALLSPPLMSMGRQVLAARLGGRGRDRVRCRAAVRRPCRGRRRQRGGRGGPPRWRAKGPA